MSTPELEIVVDATYKLTMGWGNVWAATVREVKVGALADRELQLSLMDDPEGALYGGRFKDLGPQRGVTLRLRRIDRRPAALVGFVAGDGTIWQVESAR